MDENDNGKLRPERVKATFLCYFSGCSIRTPIRVCLNTNTLVFFVLVFVIFRALCERTFNYVNPFNAGLQTVLSLQLQVVQYIVQCITITTFPKYNNNYIMTKITSITVHQTVYKERL